MNADEYIEKELKNAPWITKYLGRIPIIKTTLQLASDRYNSYGNSKTYSLSVLFIISRLIPCCLFTLSILYFTGLALLDSSTNALPYMLVLVLPGAGLYFIAKDIGKSPSSVYRMTISREEINLGSNSCKWADIEDTLISTRSYGKTSKTCLILLMKDNSIVEIDLFRIGYSEKELASCIEYYKPTAH